ncbi:RDD family protein [Methanobrevibacter sp. UBA212]|uniref:RDD family protein n=1 Tax=Methanobrevibacter sp. UBA212 TaxID=1915476 RepID=UPI0025CEFCFD|nr:RDD family protein [Methanobrevibacter sp. UBA212]
MATIFTRRVIAYLLDFLVVSAFMWIISFFLYGLLGPKNVYQAYQVIPFLMPVLGLLYFILCEKIASASIGKAIMKLEVKSRNGANISWLQAIVRNLSKIYWIPIIFDWLIGRFLKTDRILNNITRTTVVNAW